ncbi:Ribonuclease P protein subunit p29 [Lamellibrachia satsuma]|nr:Ribonuclease P protein subunit p29 [Lamellibrachia satsuma]
MKRHAAEGSPYSALPSYVEEANADVLGPKPKQKSVDKLLRQFLQNRVCEKRLSEGIADDLKFRVEKLEVCGKKRRKFQLTRAKRKTLTARERRQLKLFEIQPAQQRYDMYVPLHELWNDYIRDLLKFDKATEKSFPTLEERLLKADYHGCIITVTRAKCPSLVGACGIVLQETKNTLRIIAKDDRLKTIPKQNTVFTIKIDGYVVTIYGNNFRYKATDRSSRRFRTRHTIDM